MWTSQVYGQLGTMTKWPIQKHTEHQKDTKYTKTQQTLRNNFFCVGFCVVNHGHCFNAMSRNVKSRICGPHIFNTFIFSAVSHI